MGNFKLSKKKIKEIESFLHDRFNTLQMQRSSFDSSIKDELDIYNDIDKHQDDKEDTEERLTVPYVYTIVQTMVARLLQALFGEDNYVRVYLENEKFKGIEEKLQSWLQNVLDAMKLKSRARDFIESSLVQRTVWLHPRPVVMKGENALKKIDFDIFNFFDIWFDTTAKKVEDTDFFARKIQFYHRIFRNKSHYFNVEEVAKTQMPYGDEDSNDRDTYQSKHKETYTEHDNSNILSERKIELLEWYGVYNVGDEDNPDFKDVIFTWANRTTLIRAEENTMRTERKNLFFPMRPLRQANTLIGKSVPMLTKKMAYELNEIRSLRLQNFKTQIKLLFKARRDSGIDYDELFAEGGNVIGYDENKDDIDVFPIPNLTQVATFMSGDVIQDMQQVTGAVDYLMGTTAARGVTETASGINTITEQALFKFGMMAANVYDDLLDFINFVIILYIKYNKSDLLVKHPDLRDFFNQSEEEIEASWNIDIALTDLAQRRDTERAQFINAMNIIGGLLQGAGGNVKALLKETMKKLKMDNIDEILEGGGEQQSPQEVLAEAAQKRGGSPKANPQADNNATIEETAFNQNTPT